MSDKSFRKFPALILFQATLLIAIFLCLPCFCDASESLPNIIFIVLDAARADHFSCYGYAKNTTPRMDSIAGEGAIFMNNYSQATRTVISVPQYMSSRYFVQPLRNVIDDILGQERMEMPHSDIYEGDEQQVFMPEILSDHAYKTLFITDGGRGIGENNAMSGYYKDRLYIRSRPYGNEVISAAISWIESHKDSRFFVYCHIASPHVPYIKKEEDLEFILPGEESKAESVRHKLRDSGRSSAGWTKEEIRILRALYDGNLKYADKRIGALYDKLAEFSLDKNTLFIISSDHGENLGQHQWLQHGSPPWDSATHVPLIMVYPPGIPKGMRVLGMTESIDIMPTVMDICGIELPEGKTMDGISLLKHLEGPESGKQAVYTRYSVRTGEYKYIDMPDGKPCLYDIIADPGETNDIIQQHPLIADKPKSLFKEMIGPREKLYMDSKKGYIPKCVFCYDMSGIEVQSDSGVDFFRKNVRTYVNRLLDEGVKKERWVKGRSDVTYVPPEASVAPIRVSAAIPNTAYRVYALIEVNIKEFSIEEAKKIDLMYRFPGQKTFNRSSHVDSVDGLIKRYSYFYFDLGKVEIKDSRFKAELTFRHPDQGISVLRFFKFIPEGCEQEEPPDKEEIREDAENLRSLGYLQ
ncbi:sulfatase [Candidatus Omnitrophota bacterium]